MPDDATSPAIEARLIEAWRLSAMLIEVSARAKADFAATIEPFGLPIHLARAILALDAPAPMSELAERLACDRSYVTGLADGLEERGLATRVPGEDRRVKLLALTPAGASLRGRISRAVAERSLVLRRLDDDGRLDLAPLLERLLDDSPEGD